MSPSLPLVGYFTEPLVGCPRRLELGRLGALVCYLLCLRFCRLLELELVLVGIAAAVVVVAAVAIVAAVIAVAVAVVVVIVTAVC